MDISLSLEQFNRSQIYSAVRSGLDLLKQLGDRVQGYIAGVPQANGPVNLLTYSNDLSQWTSFGGSYAGNRTDANGGNLASRITSTASGNGYYKATVLFTPGLVYTAAICVKPISGSNVIQLGLNQSIFGASNGDRVVNFDCGLGTLFSKSNEITSWSARKVNNEFWIITGTFTCIALNPPTGAIAVYGVNAGQQFLFSGAGIFQGNYTADQIASSGGIPLTTTSPAAYSYSSFLSGASLIAAVPEKTAVGPVNLFRYSSNLLSGWTAGGSGSTILSETRLRFSSNPQSQAAQGTNALTVEPYTYAVLVSTDSGTRNVRLKHWDGTTDNFTGNLQISSTPTLLVQNTTGTTFAATNFAICSDTIGTVGEINVLAQGLFKGTFTASQIIANGGIPITTDTPLPNFVQDNVVVQSPGYGADIGPSTRSVSGWSTNNCTITSDGSAITVNVVTAPNPAAYRSVTVVPGQVYEVQYTLQRGTTVNGNQFKLGLNAQGNEYWTDVKSTSGTYSTYVVPTSATLWITMGFGETAVGQTSIWSDIRVRPVITQAEKNIVVNGDFSNGTTGWSVSTQGTITTVNNQLEITSTTTGAITCSQPFNLIPNARYLVIGKYWDDSGEGVAITAMSTQFGSTFASAVTAGGVSSGTLVFSFTAPQANVWIGPRISNATAAGKKARFDDIIVQQIITSPSKLSPQLFVDSNAGTPAAVDGPVGFLGDADCNYLDPPALNYRVANQGTISQVNHDTFKFTFAASTSDPFVEYRYIPGTIKGRNFEITWECWTDSGQPTFIQLFAYGSDDSSDLFNPVHVLQTYSSKFKYVYSPLTSTQTNFSVRYDGQPNSASGGYFYFKAPVVREIKGNPAIQATTANKPILRRGVTNLVLRSHDFSQSNWAAQAGTTGFASTIGPDGVSRSYSRFVPDTSTAIHRMSAVGQDKSGAVITTAMKLKTSGMRYVYVNTGASLGAGLTIDLQTGSFSAAGVSLSKPFVKDLGNGWFWLQYVGVGTGFGAALFLQANPTVSITTDQTYTGDGVNGFFMDGVAQFAGDLTYDQIIACGGIPVTSSTVASSTKGNFCLSFNGSTNILSLPTAPVSKDADHSVIVGCTSYGFGGDKTVFGMRSSSSNTPVLAQLGFSSDKVDFAVRDDAGGLYRATDVSSVSNSSLVVISGNKKGPVLSARKNGITVGSVVSNLGVTSVNNFTIGAVTVPVGTANQFDGLIYAVIIVNGTLTDDQLLTLERFVGALTGPTGVVF